MQGYPDQIIKSVHQLTRQLHTEHVLVGDSQLWLANLKVLHQFAS